MILREMLLWRMRELGAEFSDELEAERVVRAALAGLAETLPRAVRFLFASELPRELRDVLLLHRDRRPIEREEFLAALHRRANLTLAHARTHGPIVCRALSDLMPIDVRARVMHALQPSMRELMTGQPAIDDRGGYSIARST